MTVLAAAALAACSSLDVNEDEAVAENFPADFNSVVYSNLHPVLHSFEIRDYVTAYNAQLKKTIGDAEFTKLQSEENLTFVGTDSTIGDTAHLHAIFVDPRLVGYSEQRWNDLWLSTTQIESTTVWSKAFLVSCTLNPPKIDTAAGILPVAISVVDSTEMDSVGNYTVIYGKTDSTAESVAYVLSDSTYTIRKGSAKKDSTIIEVKQDTVVKQGYFSSKEIEYAKSFNMVGVAKDSLYIKLLSVPADDFAISYQYVVFGRSHGWAYRPCTEVEKTHPIQTEVYPMKKYYCDDNGIAKEI